MHIGPFDEDFLRERDAISAHAAQAAFDKYVDDREDTRGKLDGAAAGSQLRVSDDARAKIGETAQSSAAIGYEVLERRKFALELAFAGYASPPPVDDIISRAQKYLEFLER